MYDIYAFTVVSPPPSPIQKKKSNILNTICFEIEMYILKSLKNYKELEL
jgi:hypothetical protein